MLWAASLRSRPKDPVADRERRALLPSDERAEMSPGDWPYRV